MSFFVRVFEQFKSPEANIVFVDVRFRPIVPCCANKYQQKFVGAAEIVSCVFLWPREMSPHDKSRGAQDKKKLHSSSTGNLINKKATSLEQLLSKSPNSIAVGVFR